MLVCPINFQPTIQPTNMSKNINQYFWMVMPGQFVLMIYAMIINNWMVYKLITFIPNPSLETGVTSNHHHNCVIINTLLHSYIYCVNYKTPKASPPTWDNSTCFVTQFCKHIWAGGYGEDEAFLVHNNHRDRLLMSCDNLDWDPTILMWKLRFNTQVVELCHFLRTYANQDCRRKGRFGASPLHQEAWWTPH